MEVDTREIARQLRKLPMADVDGYCRDCGFTDRERLATIDYLYCRESTASIVDRLGISRSTFIRHEKVLAYRMLRYMVSRGIIAEIQQGRQLVADLAPETIFGR